MADEKKTLTTEQVRNRLALAAAVRRWGRDDQDTYDEHIRCEALEQVALPIAEERDALAKKLRASERAAEEALDDRARALRIGYAITVETQSCEEMAVSLVEMVRAARGGRDALRAEVERLRAREAKDAGASIGDEAWIESLREKAAKVRTFWDASGVRAMPSRVREAINDLLNALDAKGK